MRSAPTSTTAATPPRCVRRVVYVANSHPSQPLRHAQIKQREVTVLRNLPIPCSNPDFGSQVANLLFLLRRRRVAHSGQFHGVGAATLSTTRLLVALRSSNETTNSISTP